jgi:hypothetical protein
MAQGNTEVHIQLTQQGHGYHTSDMAVVGTFLIYFDQTNHILDRDQTPAITRPDQARFHEHWETQQSAGPAQR